MPLVNGCVVYFVPPMKGSPYNWVSVQGSEKTGTMWLPDGWKSFKIGLAVVTQYWRVTDRQTDSHLSIAFTRYAYLRRAVMKSKMETFWYYLTQIHLEKWLLN